MFCTGKDKMSNSTTTSISKGYSSTSFDYSLLKPVETTYKPQKREEKYEFELFKQRYSPDARKNLASVAVASYEQFRQEQLRNQQTLRRLNPALLLFEQDYRFN